MEVETTSRHKCSIKLIFSPNSISIHGLIHEVRVIDTGYSVVIVNNNEYIIILLLS